MDKGKKHSRPLLYIGSLCVLILASFLAACGSSNSTGSTGPVTITVAYQQFGAPPYPEETWWKSVQAKLAKTDPNIKLKLLPVVADEGSYYTKIDLMLRSANTAPDIVREDSFLVSSDVTAGYLAPLDSYLASWPEYKQQWFPTMQSITTFNGHNYGIMDGTDVRLIWYNKDIFKKAGLPTTWQPNNWNDILSAANTIKSKVSGVIPLNLYSGVPMDEASTMQGMEMLLYGTKDTLYDYNTKKWVTSSPGFQDSLDFVKQVYNPNDLLGPSNDIALNTTAGTVIDQQLIPQGKVGIAIDGSWISGYWLPTGPTPWTQWQTTMGVAKMPTQDGSGSKYISMSGGWAYSIAARSQHPAQAFEVLKTAFSKDELVNYDVQASQITPRQDIAQMSEYSKQADYPFYTSLVAYSQFRPGFVAYPKISLQIDSAMQHVMSGQSSADAMKAYSQSVIGIVGANNTEQR